MTQAMPVVGTREGDTNTTAIRSAWEAGRGERSGVLARDAAVFFHQALSTPCLDEIVGARGGTLTTGDGRRIFDLHGNSTHQIGFGHAKVVEALAAQARELPFCTRRFTNARAVELAERLVSLAPPPLTGNARVLFAPGGTQAVSMAVHIARAFTGRSAVLTMEGSFHGASLDVAPLAGERVAEDHEVPPPGGSLHARPAFDPDCGGCTGGRCDGKCVESIVEQLERRGDVAAVLMEPARTSTVAAPPASYWQDLRSACDRTGTLLIIDEIPTGLGRAGKLFASEALGIRPDLVTIGKGLGGGLVPFAACIGRSDLNDGGVIPLRARSVGHFTHEKSPIGSAVAMAVLDVILENDLPSRAALLGESWAASLESALADDPGVQEIRRVGLMVGVVLGGDGARERAERTMLTAYDRGLNFKVGNGQVLVLHPPLTVSEEELAEITRILVGVLGETRAPTG